MPKGLAGTGKRGLLAVWTWLGAAAPRTLFSAVANGIITRSSWSCPHPLWPFGLSTPITRSGKPFTRMVAPTGSSWPPKICSATVLPIRTTSAALCSSASVSSRPAAIFQLAIGRYSGVTPWTLVVQFWPSYST